MEDQDGDEVVESQSYFFTPRKQKIRKASKKSPNKKSTKSRTPSGQVLNTSVKDIRNFFAEKIVPQRVQNLHERSQSPITTSFNDDYQSATKHEWKVVKGIKAIKTNSASNQPEPTFQKHLAWRCENRFSYLKDDLSSIDSESDIDDTSSVKCIYKEVGNKLSTTKDLEIEDYHDQGAIQTSSIDSESDIDDTSSVKCIYKEVGNKLSTTKDLELEDYHDQGAIQTMAAKGAKPIESGDIKSSEYHSIVQLVKDMSQEQQQQQTDGAEPDVLEAIDVRTVVKMFNKIQLKLDDRNQDEVHKLKKEVELYKRKHQVMSGIVGHLSTIISDVESKMDIMDLRSMRRHLIVSGIETTGRITECTKKIEKVFAEKFEIEIKIIDGFKLGVGPKKPIVVLVDSIVSRAAIFQAMETYRKTCEEEDIAPNIFVSDYIPAEKKEKKRREKEILRQNQRDTSSTTSMTIEKTGLKVNGDAYKPRISPPDPTKVLEYSEAHLDAIYDTELTAGEKITHDGSVFTAFVIPANAHLTVENAYMKLRLKYPLAKSIMCGYSIPGMPRYQHEEFCDDRETSGGRVIMNLIKKHHLSNIALFVIREQKGGNIGYKRFECIQQAIENVMSRKPYNKFTNSRQYLMPDKQDAFFNNDKRGERPIRSNHRGGRWVPQHPHPADNSDDNAGNKRRRKSSPIQQKLNFSEWDIGSNPLNINPFASLPTADTNLGGSWPTLQQSLSNGKTK